MTSEQVAASLTNPLTDLPLLGGVVEVVDSLLTDLGIPQWFAETIEFCGVLILLFVLLLQLVRRVLPWLVTVLDPLVTQFFDGVAMILLVPELITTRVRSKMGKPPLAAAYSYGDGVLGLSRLAMSVTRAVLMILPRIRQAPRIVLVVLAVLFVLTWNSGTCTSTEVSRPCVSPASTWVEEAGQWFEKNGKE